MAPTRGRSSGRPTLFRFWRGRRYVVCRQVVDGDQPPPVHLVEQSRVPSLGDARAALQAILTDQHRRIGGEQIDLHGVEVQAAAPLGRAAIVTDVMVERALPALLEF